MHQQGLSDVLIKRRIVLFFALSAGMVLFDQVVKMLVHFNMELGAAGEIQLIGDWLKLHYTLNPGMAFGMQLGSEYGKLILSVFRLLAVGAIAWYMVDLIKTNAPKGFIFCVALILGGALGNVVDSTFYGVLLDNAPYGAPTPWFHGQVIDMFYFDIWEGFLPGWIPLMGGEYYSFWPIFNVADSSIFVGVCMIIISQKKYFPEKKPKPTADVEAS